MDMFVICDDCLSVCPSASACLSSRSVSFVDIPVDEKQIMLKNGVDWFNYVEFEKQLSKCFEQIRHVDTSTGLQAYPTLSYLYARAYVCIE